MLTLNDQIISNLRNIRTVWGESSIQYREAEAMAAEYLHAFLGSAESDISELLKGLTLGGCPSK